MSTPSASTCPSCGSDDAVRGRPDVRAGDVELSCDRCTTSWWRGGRPCATCGGGTLTTRPQVMRRGHDPASVADWVRSTWGSGDRAGHARHTLTALADHWVAHGWTTTDLAAALRPQEDA